MSCSVRQLEAWADSSAGATAQVGVFWRLFWNKLSEKPYPVLSVQPRLCLGTSFLG